MQMKKVLIFSFVIISIFISNGLISAQTNHEITALEIKGNQYISNEKIMSKIDEVEVGEMLKEQELKNDLQAIFNMGSFQNIKPKFEQHKNGVKIIIEVVENPILKKIEFTGTKVFDKSRLMEWLGVKPGQVINMETLKSGIQKIEKEYQKAGYVPTNKYPGGYHYIDFDNVNITKEGEITIPVNVGKLNEIILKGNTKTKDFVILRELNIKKGEILKMDQVRKDLQDLYRLNYFKEINPQPIERMEESNKVNLKINFVERKTGTFNFGGGYSSKNGWIGFFKVKEDNLLGRGQRLGFEWEFGGTDQLSLNFYEPRIFGSETSFGISFFDKTEEREDHDNDVKYDEEREGGSITLGHPLNESWRGSFTFKLEDWKENYPTDSSIEDNTGKTRSITLTAKQDSRNHPFNPTGGSMNTISVEHAGPELGGDQEFNKFNYDGRKYVEGFKEGHAWALRLKTGFGSDDLPDTEKYYLGGARNLRGFEEGSLKGDSLALLNIEYRFPIHDNFTGVVFSDTGNTWDSVNDIHLEEVRFSAGLGVRMNTPLGQIRLDYGWNDDGEGMPHFSIGQTF